MVQDPFFQFVEKPSREEIQNLKSEMPFFDHQRTLPKVQKLQVDH